MRHHITAQLLGYQFSVLSYAVLSNRALIALQENMKDVDRLLEIHRELSGTDRGRRYGVEVLNKSGLVLVTACWEAFVEDLATEAFNIVVERTPLADALPARLRGVVADELRKAPDPTLVWALADGKWRQALVLHKDKVLKKYVSSLNTPKPEQVDALFEEVLGLRGLSDSWKWFGTTASASRRKLTSYVSDRGAVAHRVTTSAPISKKYITAYRDFAYRLAVTSTNAVNGFVHSVTRTIPWFNYTYGKTS